MILYIIMAMTALSVIAFCKSQEMMNAWTMLHALSALLLSLSFLAQPLPLYYFESQFLFIDHLSVYEMLIAAFIFLIAAIYARGYVGCMIAHKEMHAKTLKPFYLAFNALMISIFMAFCANNLALFWLFTELTTLFSAILIVTPNAKENIAVALSYVFIASTSMLFSFIGLILLFGLTKHALGAGTLNWNQILAASAQLPPSALALTAIFLFIGFATKSGIVPFHSWLPHAHAIAPSVISTILSGVMLNVGMYGLLRVYAIMRPTAAQPIVSKLFITFGLLSIGLAALTMLTKRNLKRLIAFSSIENMGLLLVGIGIGTPAAIFWTLFHVLSHSFAKALLFLLSGIIRLEYHSVQADDVDHLLTRQPLASFGLILGGLAIIGTPMMPNFLSKMGILLQLGAISLPLVLLAALLFMLVAAAFALFMMNMFSRQREQGQTQRTFTVPLTMHLAILVLIFALLICGVVIPTPLKETLTQAVSNLNI